MFGLGFAREPVPGQLQPDPQPLYQYTITVNKSNFDPPPWNWIGKYSQKPELHTCNINPRTNAALILPVGGRGFLLVYLSIESEGKSKGQSNIIEYIIQKFNSSI